jgi:hypothetical protein
MERTVYNHLEMVNSYPDAAPENELMEDISVLTSSNNPSFILTLQKVTSEKSGNLNILRSCKNVDEYKIQKKKLKTNCNYSSRIKQYH